MSSSGDDSTKSEVMRRDAAILLLVASFAAAACGGGSTTESASSTAPSATSVDWTSPSTSAAQSDGIGIETVVDGLDRPTAVAALPNGDLIALEQHAGRVRLIRDGVLLEEPLLDLGDEVSTDSEQGLLGIALDVDAAENGRVFLNHTDLDGATRVLEYPVEGGVPDAAAPRELLRVAQPSANHNGGHLVFGPNGLLWIGLGDGGGRGDPENRAQDPDDLLGKMLRIDPNAPNPTPEVWATGLRNPWRYAIDQESGTLWIADVGQNSYEEVSRVDVDAPAGSNFGWRLFEGMAEYDNPEGTVPTGYVPPIAQYGHEDGCSVTGGLVVRDPALPALDGRYLYGDYCSGRLWTLPADAEQGTQPADVTDLLGGPVDNLVSFGEDAEGRVLIVSADGRILRIVPR